LSQGLLADWPKVNTPRCGYTKREGFATVASRELCPPAIVEESTMNTAAKLQTDNRHGSAFDLDVESSQNIRWT
jgi:hypothetical protein